MGQLIFYNQLKICSFIETLKAFKSCEIYFLFYAFFIHWVKHKNVKTDNQFLEKKIFHGTIIMINIYKIADSYILSIIGFIYFII